jgi:hypothetical protein
MLDRFITLENKTSQPITANGNKLTLFSQALTVRLPGLKGGLVWNRPLSVLIQTADGQETVQPVPDVTRQAIWGLLGISIVAPIFAWLLIGRRRNT